MVKLSGKSLCIQLKGQGSKAPRGHLLGILYFISSLAAHVVRSGSSPSLKFGEHIGKVEDFFWKSKKRKRKRKSEYLSQELKGIPTNRN